MHPFALLLARLALGAVWIIAGLSKLSERESWRQAINNFGPTSRQAAYTLGAVLPWCELTLGALLIIGQWTTAAAGASAILLAIFSVVIAINLLHGRKFECRCFGQMGRRTISWLSVVRNAVLLLLALSIALIHSGYMTLDGWREGVAPLSTDPPLIEFLPILLLALSACAAWCLLLSAWQVIAAIAKTEDGPASGTPEHRRLRAWLALDSVEPTSTERS